MILKRKGRIIKVDIVDITTNPATVVVSLFI